MKINHEDGSLHTVTVSYHPKEFMLKMFMFFKFVIDNKSSSSLAGFLALRHQLHTDVQHSKLIISNNDYIFNFQM